MKMLELGEAAEVMFDWLLQLLLPLCLVPVNYRADGSGCHEPRICT